MQVIHTMQAAALPQATALALGYFDGVHLGHRAVIQAMVDTAAQNNLTPAVFTFTLQEGQSTKGRRLQTNAQKHEMLAQLGVQLCFEPPFGSFFSLTPATFFSQQLVQAYRAKALFCGENFSFGQARSGNVQLLGQLCAQQGIQLTVVPTTIWQGDTVSSSRIRRALERGDLPAANAMLGRPYEVCLPVQHGQGLGHTLGFPTINQSFPQWMQPPAQGVYISSVLIGQVWYPAATGYGTRPTVQGQAPTFETFIPGFSGNLYGNEINVRLYQKIADTQKFDSTQALAKAVQGWATQAKAYFAE